MGRFGQRISRQLTNATTDSHSTFYAAIHSILIKWGSPAITVIVGIDFIGWKFDGDAILAQFMGKTGLMDSEAFSVTKTTGMTRILKLFHKLMILDFGSVQWCALPAFTRLTSFPNMIMNSRRTKLGGGRQCNALQ